MDSLDALRRWDAKRAEVFKKIAQKNERAVILPERKKITFRTRPGEVSREEFGSWVGALAPDSGAVNEFRTKMYQSELRGLENRVVTDDRLVHPMWALWQPRTYQQPEYNTMESITRFNGIDGPTRRLLLRQEAKDEVVERRTAPGIEPFFINTVNEAPLLRGGASMCGGALTQLSRSNAKTAKISDKVQELARQQARQATAFRKGALSAPPPPTILTALDEAKLQIGTTIETIAQQILRGVYTTDILRDLTTISASIARNAPLMDAGALGELLRYMNDLLNAMRGNAKNTGKEIAEDNLLEFAEEPEFYGETWRSFIGNPAATATQADARDLDKGVKQAEGLAESIYARVEALTEFIRKQFAASELPMAERIQVARAALPGLGTNIDRKTYPADLKKRFEKEEKEAQQKMEAGDLLELQQGVVPAPSIDLLGEPGAYAAPFASEAFSGLPGAEQAALPALGTFEAPAVPTLRISEIVPPEEEAQLAGFTESTRLARPEGAEQREAEREAIKATKRDLMIQYSASAQAAAEAGDLRSEIDNARIAYQLAVDIDEREFAKQLKATAKARGFSIVPSEPIPPRRLVPQSRTTMEEEGMEAEEGDESAGAAVAAAPLEVAPMPRRRMPEVAAEEQVVGEEEEEEAPASAGATASAAASAAAASRGTIVLGPEQFQTFYFLFTGDRTIRPDPRDAVPRSGKAWDDANSLIHLAGRRRINKSSGTMTASEYFKRLDAEGFAVDMGDGTVAPISSLIGL